MSATEEVQEHAEHASSGFDKRVAASMAMIAAALAIVTVMGHISTTDELLKQQQASDQWSYYQAKSIRRYASEVARDMFAALQKSEGQEAYTKNAEKYRKEMEEIQDKAHELENESKAWGNRALRLHFGGVFLELGIVFCSLAILTKRSLIWYSALILAVVGVVIGSPQVAAVLQEMIHH
jgi:hypothetical protein